MEETHRTYVAGAAENIKISNMDGLAPLLLVTSTLSSGASGIISPHDTA